MAETATKSTKEQVKELHDQGKSPQEIAVALEKTPATVYNHLRGLGLGHGKRGRPRKTDAEKAESKSETKPVATRPRPGAKSATSAATAKANGHDAARFPAIKAAIEQELTEARTRVTVLEGMLEAIE